MPNTAMNKSDNAVTESTNFLFAINFQILYAKMLSRVKYAFNLSFTGHKNLI